MKNLFIVLILFGIISCGNQRESIDKFTYNFQFYNYENDQVDDKGETDLGNILNEFRNFPWDEQVNKLNLPDVKSNPTIGIKDQLNDYDFGITAYQGDSNNIGFVIYHSYLVEGEWEESFREGYRKEAIAEALKLFFKRQHDELPNYLLNNSKGEFGIPFEF